MSYVFVILAAVSATLCVLSFTLYLRSHRMTRKLEEDYLMKGGDTK